MARLARQRKIVFFSEADPSSPSPRLRRRRNVRPLEGGQRKPLEMWAEDGVNRRDLTPATQGEFLRGGEEIGSLDLHEARPIRGGTMAAAFGSDRVPVSGPAHARGAGPKEWNHVTVDDDFEQLQSVDKHADRPQVRPEFIKHRPLGESVRQ